jgi:hypothetical protein
MTFEEACSWMRGRDKRRDLGFYVDGRYYGVRQYQARARAKELSNLYGRDVRVILVLPASVTGLEPTDLPQGPAPHVTQSSPSE